MRRRGWPLALLLLLLAATGYADAAEAVSPPPEGLMKEEFERAAKEETAPQVPADKLFNRNSTKTDLGAYAHPLSWTWSPPSLGHRCERTLKRYFHKASQETLAEACTALFVAAPEDPPAQPPQRRLGGEEEEGGEEESSWAKFTSAQDYVNLGVALACVCGAALAAGLTMSVVSLEAVDLRIKLRSGTPAEQRAAERLLPIVKLRPHHRLLVTLLLCNAIFNEALPLFLDALVPSWAAVLVSVTMVLFFGEIIPSAIFTGPNKLQIASSLANLVWCLTTALAPVVLPIAWTLDALIPEEDAAISKNEVRALVAVHREIAREEGHAEPFNEDEEDMIKGALTLSTRVVEDDIVPFEKVFMLSIDDVLDEPTMRRILDSGFSRIPVRAVRRGGGGGGAGADDPPVLVGYLLVKDHIMVDPKDAVPVRSLPLYTPICALPSISLAALLNEFQTGASHMAFVTHSPALLRDGLAQFALLQRSHSREEGGEFAAAPPPSSSSASASASSASNGAAAAAAAGERERAKSNTASLSSIASLFSKRSAVLGIITIEDVIEVLLTEQVYDESDKKLATERLVGWMRSVAVPALRSRISSTSPTAASASAASRRLGGRTAAGAAAPASRSGLSRQPSLRQELRRQLSSNPVPRGGGGGGDVDDDDDDQPQQGEFSDRAQLARNDKGGGGAGDVESGLQGGAGGRIRRAFSERRQWDGGAEVDEKLLTSSGDLRGGERSAGGGALGGARGGTSKRYLRSAKGSTKEPLLATTRGANKSYGSDDE